MAVLVSENFDGGTLGAAVLAADTIFASISNTGITYVTGLDGSTRACNINPSTTASVRDSGFTAQGKIVTRYIFKISGLPSVDTLITTLALGDPNAGGTRIAHLYLTPAGKITVKNVYITVGTTATTFALNTEYALEWMFDGATQQQTLRVFTNVSSVASPAETVGPVAANAGPLTADWVQVGKLISSTWTGGLTIDKYKRADNWVASAANVLQWNQEWVGTSGNDIALPVGWTKEGVNTNSPKYLTGGPNTDQSVLSFGGQTSGNRNLLSPQLPTGVITYERFYVSMSAKPENASENECIWSVGSLAGNTLFRLVAVGGVNNLYDLQLWADDNWNPTAPPPLEGEPALPSPLGVITNLNIDVYHRIEITISAAAGPATCTVKIWKDRRRNLETSPDQTIAGVCVGTTSTRYRRFGQMLHSSVANTVTHRGVQFDGMVTSQDNLPIGPLDPSVQFDPPLGSQWEFSEWTGVVERALSVAGASLGGATLEQVNIGDTAVTPPGSGGLFTNDPGLGSKLYVTANAYNASDRYNLISDLFNFEMRTLSAGGSHPASNRIAPGCYRGFYVGRPSISMGAHTDSAWSLHRKIAANTAISSWSFDQETYLNCIEMYDGTADSWYRNQVAPWLIEAYERYGHLTILDLANEPDAWSNAPTQARVPRWYYEVKRAARYMHFFLIKQCGVPEEAFMISVGTFFAQTSQDHPTRHTKALLTTDLQWSGNLQTERGDALYFYCPDWKHTRTVADGYWSDAYDPNPVDFIQPGEMDQWSYGRGPIQRMFSYNFYERDYEYANITTFNQFKATVPSLDGGYPRGGNLYKFNRALFGGAVPVLRSSSANNKGIPVFIGELGMGVWCPLPTSSNPADPALTADAYCQAIIPDLVQNCNVVAYGKWRYVVGAYGGTDLNVDTYTHHWKVGSGAAGGTHLYDSTNANTKAEAAIFNTEFVADPPPWPNGTVRPPYVSRNGGAKRDYRGFADVP